MIPILTVKSTINCDKQGRYKRVLSFFVRMANNFVKDYHSTWITVGTFLRGLRVVLEHLKHPHDASERVLALPEVLQNWQLLPPEYISRPLRSLRHFSQAYLISHRLTFLNEKNALNFRYSLVLLKNSHAGFHTCMQTHTHRARFQFQLMLSGLLGKYRSLFAQIGTFKHFWCYLVLFHCLCSIYAFLLFPYLINNLFKTKSQNIFWRYLKMQNMIAVITDQTVNSTE